MRKQEDGETADGETADSFITDLYTLAEHCEYSTLHDQMIRDRIVVGIRDAALWEKLQMDADLTLEKAITAVRQSEAVKLQQVTLKAQATKSNGIVDAIKRVPQRQKQKGSRFFTN